MATKQDVVNLKEELVEKISHLATIENHLNFSHVL